MEDDLAGDELEKKAIKRHLQELQDSFRAMRYRVPKNVSKMFTLAMELVKVPVASASESVSDVTDKGLAFMADTLMKA